MTIQWKAVEQHFTVVLFVFQFCNFGKFITFALCSVRSEWVKLFASNSSGTKYFKVPHVREVLVIKLKERKYYWHLPKQTQATNLIRCCGGEQSEKNGFDTYSAKIMAIIAQVAGLMMMTAVQENKKAGTEPKTSSKYAYSPPDFLTHVPNSM